MKWQRIVALFAISSMLLTGTALVERAESPKLKVGFIVSLTGALADFGDAIRNGVTLAIEESPDISQRFVPIYEDSRYESPKAVTALKKLNAIDKVDAVYVFGGPMSAALAPLAESMKLPMFSTEYDVRYTKGRKYVFRFANNASDYASALAEELKARKIERIGIIKEENQYHNTLSSALLGLKETPWRSKLLANFQPGENDFRATITRLRNESYDALGVYLTPALHRSFLSQLRASGTEAQIFGTDSFESPSQSQGLEELIEGALYANSSVSADFERRYLDRFSNGSQLVHAALAYEFIKLFADLFPKVTTSVSADEIIKRFQISKPRNSVCGKFFFRDTPQTGKYFSFPIAVRELQAGRPQMVRLVPAP